MITVELQLNHTQKTAKVGYLLMIAHIIYITKWPFLITFSQILRCIECNQIGFLETLLEGLILEWGLPRKAGVFVGKMS